MKTFTHFCMSNDWMNKDLPVQIAPIIKGWGNGYVAIPEGSFLHGMLHADIDEELLHLDTDDELTYSSLAKDTRASCDDWAVLLDQNDVKDTDWIVGFDTLHSWNDMSNSSEAKVRERTKKLAQLITGYCINIPKP